MTNAYKRPCPGLRIAPRRYCEAMLARPVVLVFGVVAFVALAVRSADGKPWVLGAVALAAGSILVSAVSLVAFGRRRTGDAARAAVDAELVGSRSRTAQPIFVGSRQVKFAEFCAACADERRALGETTDVSDVIVDGEIPYGEDVVTVRCERGHERLVVRHGSQAARDFFVLKRAS